MKYKAMHIYCPLLFLVLRLGALLADEIYNEEQFVATKRSEIVIANDVLVEWVDSDEATTGRDKVTNAKQAPGQTVEQLDVQQSSFSYLQPEPKKKTVAVIVFTTTPQLFKRKQQGYTARVSTVERIKRQNYGSSLSRDKIISLLFRFVDANPLSVKRGNSIFNEVLDLLDDTKVAKVAGVIIELLPSADTAWAQIIFDTASSLRLPVVVADTRGPTIAPPSPIVPPAEECRGSGAGGQYQAATLLSAMPSQHELDNAMLEVIFAVLKNARFAVVVIDHDEKSGAVVSSLVEELLNSATHRDQAVRLFRLRGYELDQGYNSNGKWQKAVKDVSNRWRKFAIISLRPEFERKFIHTALALGLAGRGYMYLSLNFDFHLEPLSIQCSIGDHTSVSAFRLRRAQLQDFNDDEDDNTGDDDGYDDNFYASAASGHADQEFSYLAMKTAIETFRQALNVQLEKNSTADNRTSTEKCANNKPTAFVDKVFNAESQAWLLELLNITNDGYFVRLRYIFSIKKLHWLVNPVLSTAEVPLLKKNKREDVNFDHYTYTTVKPPVPHKHLSHSSPCQNNRRLRITTILEPPFIMKKKSAKSTSNASLVGTYQPRIIDTTTPRTADHLAGLENDFNTQVNLGYHDHTGIDNYEGYCIDLLERLSLELGFSYDLTLVPDGKYGSLTDKGRWNGMIGELEKGNADVAVAPLTITQLRSNVVDFTQSFMTVGIGLLYYRQSSIQDEDGDVFMGMFSFFRPFKWDVWLAAAVSLVVYSVVHRFICWLSPAERNAPPDWTALLATTKPPALHTPHPLWTLSNSFWLAVSAILQQGCDFFPTAKSTRFLYITWGFVSMVLCSCYTANLAAFLTNERLELPVRKPTDLLGQNKTKYGTLYGGSTQSFFKNSKIDMFRELYANMARDSTLVQVQTDGVRRVIASKGKFAFFLESTKLEYEVARDCRLVQVGNLLDSKGYGIATQKGSPLRDLLSTTILKLQTEGVLQSLKNKWWVEQRVINKNIKCPGDGSSDKASTPGGRRSANKLSMEVLGGAFIVLIGGLLFGLFVCLMEFLLYGIAVAIKKDGCLATGSTLMDTWRFHIRRVFLAGATQIVLPINKVNSKKQTQQLAKN